jgi:hypothetical protein
VHLLPELAAGQAEISRATGTAAIHFAERHVYLLGLAGLAVFFGLDKLAKHSRRVAAQKSVAGRGANPTDTVLAEAAASTSPSIFWIHMGSFSLYNALIGYLLLHREATGLPSLAFFTIAMALHFFVTDFGLNEDHKARYGKTGRWVLFAAVLAGYIAGALTEIPRAGIAMLVGFLAGGVILNVLKEEVPAERQSRFWAFGAGMAVYAFLLLAV